MIELAIVILLAAGLGIAARFLRQPIVLAYLATGALIAHFGLFHIGDRETFRIFSDLGIMFLLFLIGLEIDYKSLRRVGKASLLVGLGQIAITFFVGLGIVLLFGLAWITSAFIALALTFSSTIIVVKALSDRKALGSLYGKISIGALLIQDVVAVVVLLVLAGLEQGQQATMGSLFFTTLAAVGLFAGILWLGREFFPWVFRHISRSQELLFLISLGWLFFLAALVDRIGLSIEIGGFLAGLALANSSEHYQIVSRMRPLRDFFILIFFVILGSSLVLSSVQGLLIPIVVLSLFVLIGNPLIIMALLAFMGYRKRTGFLAGITFAQISEFSFLLALSGFSLGYLTENHVALITAVGVTTITLSTFTIEYSDALFRFLRRPLSVFERSSLREDGDVDEIQPKRIVLVGGHRTGQSVIHHVPAEDILVVDFDPDVVSSLRDHGIATLFGDIADPDIGERACIEQAELVISTSPDVIDNLALLEQIGRGDNRPMIIVRAEEVGEAVDLYHAGADYVLLPYFISGHYLTRIVKSKRLRSNLERLRERDTDILRRGELDSAHKTSMDI